jgi:hypothetical protein
MREDGIGLGNLCLARLVEPEGKLVDRIGGGIEFGQTGAAVVFT